MDQDGVPRRKPPMAEQIGPDGEIGLRQGSGMRRIIALGPGQRLRLGRRAVFGIGAAIGQRANAIPDTVAGDARAHRHDFARAFQADNGRGTRRWRIAALTLRHIRAIDACRHDPDQHLIRRRYRQGGLRRDQDLRPAALAMVNEIHGGG